jgi:hydroxypyruvate reductase
MYEEQLIKDALNFFHAGVNSVLPETLFREKIILKHGRLIISDVNGIFEHIELNKYRRIIIIGAGKASAAMAKELENLLLSAKIEITGVVVTKPGCLVNLKKVQVLKAGHPIPDKKGIDAAKKILSVASSADKNDLVINLLSGGASSLLPFPVKGISLSDKIKITNLLLQKGLSIHEINVIRKHLSKIKGGKLLRYTYPAKVVSLIISDVIGDNPDIIGSGLTVPDTLTRSDVMKIINKYNLADNLPKRVLNFLLNEQESMKNSYPISDFSNIIIANNAKALSRINEAATQAGYISNIVNTSLSGEASKAGKKIAISILKFKRNLRQKNKKYCFIYGGETTVTIKGKGKGGRSQELALAAATELKGEKYIVLLSAGTDGNDGPTDAAGAFCTGSTVILGEKLGLDAVEYIGNNNSYHYFSKIQQIIKTGITCTNVADVVIVLFYV